MNHYSTRVYAERLFDLDHLKGVGGFSLVFGRAGEPLAVISNRTPKVEDVAWLMEKRGETVGLSNAAFGNRSWPKVTDGERLLKLAIEKNISSKATKVDFIDDLLALLSTDTLPKRQEGQKWETFVRELRMSIFIPKLGGEGMDGMSADEIAAARSDQHAQGLSGTYGTQKQTVVLVTHQGHVTFVERTLYDSDAQPCTKPDRDKWFEWYIDCWGIP